MTKLMLIAVLILSSPAWAQTMLVPKSVAARVDKCAPIGRIENGKLVYLMKCETLPVAVAPLPDPQAETREAAPKPEVRRTGVFGLSRENNRPTNRPSFKPTFLAS